MLYVFVSFLGPDRAQRSIAFLSFWTCWPIRTSHYFFQPQFVNKKQRIFHGQGASNINYSTVVFKFDVCRLSWPVSSTNYALIQCSPLFFLSFSFLFLSSLQLSRSFFLRSCAHQLSRKERNSHLQRVVSDLFLCFFFGMWLKLDWSEFPKWVIYAKIAAYQPNHLHYLEA